MRMTIQGLNFDLTAAILEHVRRRLRAGLSYYAPRVQRVTVRVSDLNGPKGGADKQCSFEIAAEGIDPMRVKAVDQDLYRAVDRAAITLRQRLARVYGRDRARHSRRRVSASGLPT